MGEAEQVVGVLPGLSRWEQRQGGREAQGWAVVDEDRCVLIDPLPLSGEALRGLGHLEAIVLTAAARQENAWRLRRSLGASVYAPQSVGLSEEPDLIYSAGEALPGGLSAFHAPGPSEASQVLWLTTGPRGVVFLSELVVHRGGRLAFPEEVFDPARARTSVQRILDRLPVDVLCFLEGPPILRDGARALRELLAEPPGAGEQPPA